MRRLIQKLRNQIPASKLRRLIPLRAKLCCYTRWSSVIYMLERYREIRTFISDIDIEGIDDLIPNYKENRLIGSLFIHLKDLNSVTLELQMDNITVVEVRKLFDTMIADYSEFETRLRPDAEIVLHPEF